MLYDFSEGLACRCTNSYQYELSDVPLENALKVEDLLEYFNAGEIQNSSSDFLIREFRLHFWTSDLETWSYLETWSTITGELQGERLLYNIGETMTMDVLYYSRKF